VGSNVEAAGGKAVDKYGRQTGYGKGGSIHIADSASACPAPMGSSGLGSAAVPASRHPAEFWMIEPEIAFATPRTMRAWQFAPADYGAERGRFHCSGARRVMGVGLLANGLNPWELEQDSSP